MSWPKPNVINTLKPPIKLHTGRWGLFFTALFFIVGIVLAIIWPNNNFSSQWVFWASVIVIPTVIGGVAVSIRLYLYGLAQEEYEIWQHEQKQIEQNWHMWAMQSLVVLDSYYVLPNHLTAKKILTDSTNLTTEINNTLTFDEKFEFSDYVEDLFFSMRQLLSKLPVTDRVNITIYSSPEAYNYIDDEINNAYRTAKIEQPYTLSHQLISHANIEKLTEWIDTPQPVLQLIIVNNSISSGTAFLCGFLLMDKQHYRDLNLDVAKSEILRPMTTMDVLAGIKQMVDMQAEIRGVNQLWFANLDNKQEVDILKQLTDLNISPQQTYKLENLAGNQTELSYWLSLALGCEMITTTKQNNLITAMSQNQWLFSVVTEPNRES